MSHVSTVEVEVKSAAALSAACVRLGLSAPVVGSHRVFRKEFTGLAVNLPGWRWPVVFDLAAGVVQTDNFNGYWGDRAELEKFLQAYGVEAAIEAFPPHLQPVEVKNADGSVTLRAVDRRTKSKKSQSRKVYR